MRMPRKTPKQSQPSKIEMPSEDAFTTQQIELFQSLLPQPQFDRDKLSNTIDLWDAVPKYFVTRRKMNSMRNQGGYLKKIKCDFMHRKSGYCVEITPARITDENDQEIEYYPSEREEAVEDALRKIAAEQTYGFFEITDKLKNSGVTFTLYGLMKELKKRGHTYSYRQIVDSLDIMNKCNIEIRGQNDEVRYSSAILPEVAEVHRKKYISNPKARWVVRFNALVTESIWALTYRQYNYDKVMRYKSQLTRWLHKRLVHNFTQADHMNKYHISYSTIKRDSRLLSGKNPREDLRQLKSTLDELCREKAIHEGYQVTVERGPRGKILDAKIELFAHTDLIHEIRTSNQRHQLNQKQLEGRVTGEQANSESRQVKRRKSFLEYHKNASKT